MIISFVLIVSSCGIAITFQKVNSYFGLLGGTAGVLMSGALPGICYAKLQERLKCSDVVLLVIVFLVTIIGFTGAILSILDPA